MGGWVEEEEEVELTWTSKASRGKSSSFPTLSRMVWSWVRP